MYIMIYAIYIYIYIYIYILDVREHSVQSAASALVVASPLAES